MLSSNPGFEDDAPSATERRAGCEWMRSRTGFAPHRSGDGPLAVAGEQTNERGILEFHHWRHRI